MPRFTFGMAADHLPSAPVLGWGAAALPLVFSRGVCPAARVPAKRAALPDPHPDRRPEPPAPPRTALLAGGCFGVMGRRSTRGSAGVKKSSENRLRRRLVKPTQARLPAEVEPRHHRA